MLQAEFYMSLEEWSKAEMTLQKILKTVDSEHEVALYQLSQVYLEQNQTGSALEAIRAASKNGCKNGSSNQNSVQHKEILQPLSKKCIWGPKCTPKAHLCAQIVIQEADILRARRQYQMAAQVRNNNIAYWPSFFSSWGTILPPLKNCIILYINIWYAIHISKAELHHRVFSGLEISQKVSFCTTLFRILHYSRYLEYLIIVQHLLNVHT